VWRAEIVRHKIDRRFKDEGQARSSRGVGGSKPSQARGVSSAVNAADEVAPNSARLRGIAATGLIHPHCS